MTNVQIALHIHVQIIKICIFLSQIANYHSFFKSNTIFSELLINIKNTLTVDLIIVMVDNTTYHNNGKYGDVNLRYVIANLRCRYLDLQRLPEITK